MYDLTMYDVQLIVEIACKITKKIRITQVLSYKFLIFANKFAYLEKKSYLCSRSCVRYKMTNEIVLYQPNDQLSIEVKLENETVWLTQQQMAMLFNTTRNNITLHIGNIFKEGELDKDSVCKESLLTAADGKVYTTNFYNLDVIISVGYRVKSIVGTKFRQWANKVKRTLFRVLLGPIASIATYNKPTIIFKSAPDTHRV